MGYNYDDVPARLGAEGPTEPPGEKNREVAPAVMGVMSALKAAADWFQREASAVKCDQDRTVGQMAVICTSAIAALEASLRPAEDLSPKPRPPPSPSALFRAGFDYGAMAMLYEQIPEDVRPARWGEKPPPPADWEAAWAIVRAQIAAAK